jgi:hypothetical protein
MRKTTVVFGIIGMIVLSFCAISIEAAEADFSGVWVLDKKKTRDLPHGLDSFTMIVTQNGQQLLVEAKLEGNLQEPEFKEASSGGGYLPSVPAAGVDVRTGTLALRYVNHKETYSLDGKETNAPQEGAAEVSIKLKAKWAKDGKTLDLSSVQTSGRGGQRAMLSIKERWTLSDDGEGLRVLHSVATPQGSDTLALVFRKEQGKPPNPQ